MSSHYQQWHDYTGANSLDDGLSVYSGTLFLGILLILQNMLEFIASLSPKWGWNIARKADAYHNISASTTF